MCSKTKTELKYLQQKIAEDAEEAARRVVRGADPFIEGREHLARTGVFHRRLKELEKLTEPK